MQNSQDTTIQSALEQQFAKLPEGVKMIANSDTWGETITSLATKYGLTPDQSEGLEQETFFVLMGLQPVSAYRKNLVQEAEISYDKALKISLDVNEQIFSPISEDLGRMESAMNAEEDESPSNTEPAPEETHDAETHPDHLLQTHEEMERTEGAHTHTEVSTPTVPVYKMASGMPSTYNAGSTPATSVARTAPAPANPVPSTPAPSFTTVDQKLRGLVRAEREETTIRNDVEERRKIAYKDGDPYREPLN